VAEPSGDPPLLARLTGPHSGRAVRQNGTGRRIASAAVACLALGLVFPLAVAIALAVRLESPGLPIFIQDRLGRDENSFRMLKFRTMKDGCAICDEKVPWDQRITKIGRLLRRSSLDELPQLVNIVRGEMVFVGPRPELPELLDRYRPEQRARFNAVPGLTGLWQVSGRSDLSLDQKIDLDLEYLRHRCLAFDISILLRTPMTVLRGRGAY